jgi:PrtD family type I secretion system ABC transporter
MKSVVRYVRRAFLGIAGVSVMVNVLTLTGSVYMLEVYDRVLPSRSVPTLIGLSILALALFGFQGILEALRGRVLTRIGGWLDHALNRSVFEAIVTLPLRFRLKGDGLQAVRDLDSVRGFLSGLGPTALFDLPWIPFYLGICFMFHFWIGVAALGGALLLIGLTLLTEILSREPACDTVQVAARRQGLAAATQRNAEVIHALGMRERFGAQWSAACADYLASSQRMSDLSGGFGSLSKVLRMILQSLVLGVGAFLVIRQEASAGVIIASSILTARALAPVELAITHWKSFVTARQSWARLKELLAAMPEKTDALPLPAPKARLNVESVSAVAPGGSTQIVQNVSFALEAGNGLGIIGPSGSGKSSLVRLLVGVWAPFRGKVRLDGASLDQWSADAIGRHLGYLPQDVELFAGTIAENIARFDVEAQSDAIIAAAKAAGVHDMILALPKGYETEIGESGNFLSAGQRQRIGLARALYGDPFLVVLDEPNSNLDRDGDEALTAAIRAVRARGGIVVVVAHRPSALASVDRLLVLDEGQVKAFGPRDEILAKMMRPARPAQKTDEAAGTSLRVIGEKKETAA